MDAVSPPTRLCWPEMRELVRVGATATEQGDAAGIPVLLDVRVPVTTMLARLHGPVGLDVGGAKPAETAVSVVGEVLAVRRGRSGGLLATAAGRIGG